MKTKKKRDKIFDGTKCIRLPNTLILKIEEDAVLKDRDFSYIVRDILLSHYKNGEDIENSKPSH